MESLFEALNQQEKKYAVLPIFVPWNAWDIPMLFSV